MANTADKRDIDKDIDELDASLASGPGDGTEDTQLGFGNRKDYINKLAQSSQVTASQEQIETIGKSAPGLGSSQFDINIDYETTQLEDIDKRRAELQPWYDQAGNMLSQAVIGEMIGGTLMAFGAILDNPTAVLKGLDDDEAAFGNILFDLGKDISEYSQENFKIYQTGDRFTDSGWYFQGAVSAASTVGMMIPGFAAAGLVGKLAQLVKLSQFATGLAKTATGASVMRHAENVREAVGIKEQSFNEAFSTKIAEGWSEMDARQFAEEHSSATAADNYNMNRVNLIFDVLQMGMMLRPLKGIMPASVSKLTDYKFAKQAGLLPKSNWGKTAMKVAPYVAGVEITEGFEEIVNSVSGIEAMRESRIKLGIEQDDGSTFWERAPKYLGEQEVQDGFIWGILGGAMFKGAASLIGMNETARVREARLKEIAKRVDITKEYGEDINNIINRGTVTNKDGEVIADYSTLTDEEIKVAVREKTKSLGIDMGISAAAVGNVDILQEWVRTEEFKQMALERGLASEESYDTDIKRISESIDKGKKIYNRTSSILFRNRIEGSAANIFRQKYTDLSIGKDESKRSAEKNTSMLYYAIKEDDYLSKMDTDEAIRTVNAIAVKVATEHLRRELSSQKNKDTVAYRVAKNGITKLEEDAKQYADAPLSKSLSANSEAVQYVAAAMIDSIAIDEFNNALNEVEQESNIEKIKKAGKELDKTIKETIQKNSTTPKVNVEAKPTQESKGQQVNPLQDTGIEQQPLMEEDYIDTNFEDSSLIDEAAKNIPSIPEEGQSSYDAGTGYFSDTGDTQFAGSKVNTSSREVKEGKQIETGSTLAYVSDVEAYKPLLSTTVMLPGTPISLSVDTAKAEADGISKKEVEALSTKIQEGAKLTEQDYQLLEHIPVYVTNANGERIAYIRETQTIDRTNTAEDVIGDQRKVNRKVREAVLKNGTINTVINKKFSGHPMLNPKKDLAGNPIRRRGSEVFGNNIEVAFVQKGEAIGKNGRLTTLNDNGESVSIYGLTMKTPEGPVPLREGQPLIVVKAANGKKVAIPVRGMQVQEKYADTMTAVISAWEKVFVDNIADEAAIQLLKSVDKFYSDLGIDLDISDRTGGGLSRFLNMFVYTTSLNSENIRNRWNRAASAKQQHELDRVYVDVNSKGVVIYKGRDIIKKNNDTFDINPNTAVNRNKQTKGRTKQLLMEALTNISSLAFKTKEGQYSVPVLQEGVIVADEAVKSPEDFIKQNVETVMNFEDIQTDKGVERVYYTQPMITFKTDFLSPAKPGETTKPTANVRTFGRRTLKAGSKAIVTEPLAKRPEIIATGQLSKLPQKRASLLVSNTSRLILEILEESNNQFISIEEAFNILAAQDFVAYDNDFSDLGLKPIYQPFLDNKEDLEQLKQAVLEYLTSNGLVKIKANDITQLSLNELGEQQQETEPQDEAVESKEAIKERDQSQVYGDTVFKRDMSKVMSARMKRFLGWVVNTNNNFKEESGNIEIKDDPYAQIFPEYVPIKEVLETLQRLLSDTPKNYDSVKQILESEYYNTPWLRQVVESLDNATDDMRIEFIKYTTLHNADQVGVLTSDKTSVDEYGEETKQSNATITNFKTQRLNRLFREEWQNRQRANGKVSVSEEGYEYIPKEILQEWLDKWESIEKGITKNLVDLKKNNWFTKNQLIAMGNIQEFLEDNFGVFGPELANELEQRLKQGYTIELFLKYFAPQVMTNMRALDNISEQALKLAENKLRNTLNAAILKEDIEALNNTYQTQVRALFVDMGVSMSDAAWFRLLSGKHTHKKREINLGNMMNTSMMYMKEGIKKGLAEDKPTQDTFLYKNPLGGRDNSSIRILLNLAVYNTKKGSATSFRGFDGALYQTYVPGSPISNLVNGIKNNEEFFNLGLLMQNPLTANSYWVNALKQEDMREAFQVKWFRGMREEESPKKGKEQEKFGDREHEIAGLTLFVNNNTRIGGKNGQDVALYRFLSSERMRVATIQAPRRLVGYNRQMELSSQAINVLYDIALNEARYINHIHQAIQEGKVDNPALKDGYKHFYKMEYLNDLDIRNTDGVTIDLNSPRVRQAIGSAIKEAVETQINETIKKWKKLGVVNKSGNFHRINKGYLKQVRNSLVDKDISKEEIVWNVAMDYIVNTSFANAEMMDMFTGPMAGAWNGSIEKTKDNYNKRITRETTVLPAQINSANRKVSILTIKDVIYRSEKVFNRLKNILANNSDRGASLAEDYLKITSTDAQVFVTLLEYIDLLYHDGGKITEKEYKRLRKTIMDENRSLSKEDLGFVFGIQKPVIVGKVFNPITGFEEVFEKSAILPLFKEITNGTPLDNIRKMMEGRDENGNFLEGIQKNQKNNFINHVAHQSAMKFKIGNAVEISRNGSYEYQDPRNLQSGVTEVYRSFYGIQQETPIKEKGEVTLGSQAMQNIVEGLPKTAELILPTGKEYSGENSAKEFVNDYHNIMVQLYKYGEQALIKELNFDIETGNVNLEKLKSLILTQLHNQGTAFELRKALEVIEDLQGRKQFAIPLWALGIANKSQEIINAVISDRITDLTMNGYSLPLATPTGAVPAKPLSELSPNEVNDIIWADKNYKGKTLNYSQDGSPSQIIISQIMTHPITGKQLNFEKEGWIVKGENGVKYLDTTKVDPAILKSFAFRIPNQDKNSSAYVEIIGFLPNYMNNIVIAPEEFIVQMGSDFDIDKLFGYMYYTEIVDGKLQRYQGDDIQKTLKNEMLDYYAAVMSSKNQLIQRKIHMPNSSGNYKMLAEAVDSAYSRKDTRNKKIMNSFIFDGYQSKIYRNASSSSIGIGATALDTTFNAMLQAAQAQLADGEVISTSGLVFGSINGDIKTGKVLSFAKTETIDTIIRKEDGGFTVVEARKEYKPKAEVLGQTVTIAVDDFKENIMHKINMNPDTFNAYSAVLMLGFDADYAVMLINQPIVREYIERVSSRTDGMSIESRTAVEQDVYDQLMKEYFPEHSKEYTYIKDGEETTANTANYPLTLKDMLDMVDGQNITKEGRSFNELQMFALDKYLKASRIGNSLRALKAAVNTYSTNLEPGIAFNKEKWNKIKGLNIVQNTGITNADKLIGIYDANGNITPTTLTGAASVYGLRTANALTSSLFLDASDAVDAVLNEVINSSRRINLNGSPELRKKVTNFIKAYINQNYLSMLNERGSSRQAFQKMLFIDTFGRTKTGARDFNIEGGNKSLATILQELQSDPRFEHNLFLRSVIANPAKTSGRVGMIVYDSVQAARYEESMIRNSFLDLLNSDLVIGDNGYKLSDFAANIADAALLGSYNSVAIDYLRLLPLEYYISMNYGKELNSFNPKELIENKEHITEMFLRHEVKEIESLTKEDMGLVETLYKKNGLYAVIALTPDNSEASSKFFYQSTRSVDGVDVSEFMPLKRIIKMTRSKASLVYKLVGPANIFGKDYPFVYVRVDQLGMRGMDEIADVNNFYPSSISKENNVGFRVLPESTGDKMLLSVYNNGGRDALSVNPDAIGADVLTNLGLTEDVVPNRDLPKVLQRVAAVTENQSNQAIAELFKELAKNKSHAAVTVVTKTGELGGMAIPKGISKLSDTDALRVERLKQSRESIFYSPDTRAIVFTDKALNHQKLNVEESIGKLLHEFTHAFTDTSIFAHYSGKKISEGEARAVRALEAVAVKYADMIKEGKLVDINPLLSKENYKIFTKVQQGKEATQEEKNIHDATLPYFYPVYSAEKNTTNKNYVLVSEFVANIFEYQEVRDLLNNIEHRGNKTLLDHIKALFVKLYQEMAKAMGIKQDTMLEETVKAAIDLFDSQNPMIDPSRAIQVVEKADTEIKVTKQEAVEQDVQMEEDSELNAYLQSLDETLQSSVRISRILTKFENINDKDINDLIENCK